MIDMSEIECKTTKIGGSIAVILPNEFVKKQGIKQNQKLVIDVKRHVKVRDVFGIFPEWKTPTQKLKDEVRKGW